MNKMRSDHSHEVTLSGKRIIFVLFSFELGGAERQALYLARHLQNVQQAEVEVWAFCNPGRLVEICNEYKIKWRLIPLKLQFDNRQTIINALRLGFALRAARPDILLPYMTPANIYCGLAWRFTGAKVCIWNQRNAGIEKINLYYENKAAQNVSAVIANSQQGAEYMIDSFQVPFAKMHVVHNGVTFDEDAEPKTTGRADGNEFAACMVANLQAGKDHATLFKAWALAIPKMDRPARLLVAGRFDATHTMLQQLVRELNIEKSVEFLGPVKNIPALLHSVDVGILLSPFSNWEGIPNAVLEYMLAGLPVIATNVPGIRDALGPENDEFLVPIGDAQRVSQLLTRMAEDAPLRQRTGSRNKQRAIKEFSLSRMCEETTRIICDLMRHESLRRKK